MKITSCNVKGSRSPIKKTIKILFKGLKTDIALLQESHPTFQDFHRMKKLWVGTVLGSNAVGRKAGVVILIGKNLPCDIISLDSGTQRRFYYSPSSNR